VDSGGNAKNGASGTMYQEVHIPADATSATLSAWINVTSNEPGAQPVDVLDAFVTDTSGNYLATLAIRSNLNKAGSATSYTNFAVSLLAYRGATVWVMFRATTDYSNTTTFRIDDVSLLADGT
jgi:hypothetical protein